MKKLFSYVSILLCSVLLIIVFLLWCNGAFISDRSAVLGVESLEWNGRSYSATSGIYSEGKVIAKTADGRWDIKEVEEDPSHNFVVVRSFLDQRLYVADDYSIPENGKITKAAWNSKYIADEDFLKAISDIEKQKVTSFEYETEAIFVLNDIQRMKLLYIAYGDCPVATEYRGYLGKINGNWVITTYISPDSHNENGSWKLHTVGCYSIPEEYHDILQKHYFE